MLINAILLIQDVQLLCFTIIFGFVALQRRDDPTPRWLFYSFLANAAGALFDFSSGHLPGWIARGVNLEMIPLSYALINFAVIQFMHRFKRTQWGAWAILLATLPVFLKWSGNAEHWRGDALQDGTIALEVVITGVILLWSKEKATLYPRVLMSFFLLAFFCVEGLRAWVALVIGQNPDVWSSNLEFVSSVSYVVSTSVLPLAFVWMMASRLQAELTRETILDPLTMVLNRRGLRQVLEKELARYARYQHPLSLAVVDLDHFKQLNDTHGHVAGVAELLTKLVRKTDAVARIGGEEFVLVLPHTDDVSAKILLDRVREGLEKFSGKTAALTLPVTASIGFSGTRKRKDIEVKAIMREADLALYRAKRTGRNCVAAFTSEDERAAIEPLG
ncbi:MAG: GGDEF domain-containing protein [Acidobacteriota bacterium]